MTLDELEVLALAAIRYRSEQWTDRKKFSDEQWYRLTGAVQYDFARLKCQIERAKLERGEDVMVTLKSQFGYTPGMKIPAVENYWPEGLQSNLNKHMRDMGL